MHRPIVAVTSDGNPHSALVQAVRTAGLDLVCVQKAEDIPPGTELTVLFDAEREGTVFNDAAFARKLAWLPVQCSGASARIGPIVVPGETSCYRCVKLRMQSHGADDMPGVQPANGLAYSLLMHVIAQECLKWLRRRETGDLPLTYQHMLEFDAYRLQGDVQPVYKIPTCPTCGVPAVMLPQAWRKEVAW
ncbi:TOMM precursor leader peptide-binding protein [Paenibacillus chartarius]|uniref:TOMM leader peptide-binding protein n=1 Tax=Paenibacillus chartarius TaxID=747481 RepID=A0ABV6DTC2_9BACL